MLNKSIPSFDITEFVDIDTTHDVVVLWLELIGSNIFIVKLTIQNVVLFSLHNILFLQFCDSFSKDDKLLLQQLVSFI